ncbi:JDVT-CTERM system glutamic-type intramembrane protease MrtJ [Maridesulfovibrio bastinii]|uniref:JDVT-CTERM system glutamic-type intramembrane protease MrtJ n=1 Tax=Maridesulfovibrio bastinii TaxID=47157 RepID=UPI0004149C22
MGLIGLYLPDPEFFISLKLLFAKAFIEEFLFRFLLQESLDRFFGYRFYLGPLSLANILTSLCFAALHMFSQPLIWALLTFIPSLVFGYLWQRYRSFLPSVFVHFAYNAVLFNKFI